MGRQFRNMKKNPINGENKKYALYNVHTNKDAPVVNNDNIIITSIDPGIVNFGIYVVAYNKKKETFVSIFLSKLKFDRKNNHYIDSINQLNELEENFNYFSNSHYIVIESQMSISYDNTRLGQHLITYFCSTLRNKGVNPVVVEFNSQAKTKLMGCPKGMKKPQYKIWCREKAVELLKSHPNKEHEQSFLTLFETGKRDDIGDAICQSYAWIKTLFGE